MSEFIKNLIERNLGTAPTIEPVIRPSSVVGLRQTSAPIIHPYQYDIANRSADSSYKVPLQRGSQAKIYPEDHSQDTGELKAGWGGKNEHQHSTEGSELVRPVHAHAKTGADDTLTGSHLEEPSPVMQPASRGAEFYQISQDENRYKSGGAPVDRGIRISRLVSSRNATGDESFASDRLAPGSKWSESRQDPSTQEMPLSGLPAEISSSEVDIPSKYAALPALNAEQFQRGEKTGRSTPDVRRISRSFQGLLSSQLLNDIVDGQLTTDSVSRLYKEPGDLDSPKVFPVKPRSDMDSSIHQLLEGGMSRSVERLFPLEAVTPATSINVTIGSVEIRAIPFQRPAVQPPEKTPRRKQPVLSLNEYLTERSEGRR